MCSPWMYEIISVHAWLQAPHNIKCVGAYTIFNSDCTLDKVMYIMSI